ncbi:aquaporin-11-like isoform 2-T2 [Aulostomus maculatus]
MSDLWMAVAVLGTAVLLSEAARRAAGALLPAACWIYLLEAASTFQLCCCMHELKLLGETTPLEPSVSLSLTFTMSVVHLVTSREAACNPSAALEAVCRGTCGVRAASALIACQFAAAVAARSFAACVWSLGLSDLHSRHRRFGFRCFDPLGGTVLEAAGAELACAFVIQAAAMHVHKLDQKLRVHFIAAVITALVYAGSASCILLLEKILPFLSGTSSARPDVPAALKLKTQ